MRRSSLSGVLFQNVRIFDGTVASFRSRRTSSSGKQSSDLHAPIADPAGMTVGDQRRRAHADARADRHALAHDAGAAHARAGCSRRRRLHQPGRRRRGDATRCCAASPPFATWAGRVRAQARHRRRHRRRPAHLSVRRDDHRHQRPRRLPPAVRSAAHARRPADAHGTDRRQHGRRQPGRSPRRACASSSCSARRRSS